MNSPSPSLLNVDRPLRLAVCNGCERKPSYNTLGSMKLLSHPQKRGKRGGVTPLPQPSNPRIYGDDQEKICLNSVQ